MQSFFQTLLKAPLATVLVFFGAASIFVSFAAITLGAGPAVAVVEQNKWILSVFGLAILLWGIVLYLLDSNATTPRLLIALLVPGLPLFAALSLLYLDDQRERPPVEVTRIVEITRDVPVEVTRILEATREVVVEVTREVPVTVPPPTPEVIIVTATPQPTAPPAGREFEGLSAALESAAQRLQTEATQPLDNIWTPSGRTNIIREIDDLLAEFVSVDAANWIVERLGDSEVVDGVPGFNLELDSKLIIEGTYRCPRGVPLPNVVAEVHYTDVHVRAEFQKLPTSAGGTLEQFRVWDMRSWERSVVFDGRPDAPDCPTPTPLPTRTPTPAPTRTPTPVPTATP